MRETLRQLSLALAIPIAVVAVWVVRGESAEAPPRERATAYRAELADLPLPTRERLRSPGEATDWRGVRVIPEDPTPRHRRPVLQNPSAPAPVDLAVAADSEIEMAASPSPNAAQVPRASAPSAALPALLGAPARIAAAPSAASHRPHSAPASGPSIVPATDSKVPAPSTTGKAEVKAPAESSTGKSVTPVPATPVLHNPSTPVRVAALEPTPVRSPRNTTQILGPAPVSRPDYTVSPAKLSPIVEAPVGIDEIRTEKFEETNAHKPLTPPGQTEDLATNLWLHPNSPSPSIPPNDLPLAALDHAKAAKFVEDRNEEVFSPGHAFHWAASPLTTFRTIPEPGSALLLGAALAALGAARRYQRHA